MTHPATPRRPKWVLVVVGIYILLILAAVLLPWVAGFSSDNNAPVLAIFTTVALLLIGGLLFLPIQVYRQRPMTRRSIWIPLIITGFMAGILAYAGALALWELFDPEVYTYHFSPFLILIFPAIAIWGVWAIVIFAMTRRQGKTPIALKLHQWLLAGSILELLIAIPAHIIVRRRTECCAGIMTGSAICLGVIVAIAALGPAVALLYLKRFRQIQPPQDAASGFEVILNQEIPPKP